MYKVPKWPIGYSTHSNNPLSGSPSYTSKDSIYLILNISYLITPVHQWACDVIELHCQLISTVKMESSNHNKRTSSFGAIQRGD